MKVLKFGGSSVGNPARIRRVMDIIAHEDIRDTVVVFSAFQGVTDQLIQASRIASHGDRKYQAQARSLRERHLETLAELVPARVRRRADAYARARLDDLADVLHGVFYTREITNRTLDYVMSFGELLSAMTITEALRARSIPCEFVDSRLLIKTDDNFGAGRVKYDLTYHNIRASARQHRGLRIVPGFIASTTDNDTVTLGRGGSDFTAALFGAALSASEIQIWKDVDGVMTADPRKVEKAFSIAQMTYEEAMEMSHFGAKVVNPPTMQPALRFKIPLRIKNTMNPSFPGTVIGRRDPSRRFPVTGISSIDTIALLRIQGSGLIGISGVGKRIFTALALKDINALLVTQASSEYSLCMAVHPHAAPTAKKLIEEELRYDIREGRVDEVIIEGDLSVVAIVGENMRRSAGIAGKLFQALGKNGINVVAIAQGSSELNISTVVAKEDEAKALNAIHDAFFLSGTKSLNIFLVGTGLIGGRLLRQIAQQRQVLLRTQLLDVRVQAVANSRKMLFDGSGLGPLHLKEKLARSGVRMHLNEFVRSMKSMNLPNSVFVDCTASEAVVKKYREILDASISIVTPNKKGNAGPHAMYRALHQAALKHNARFLYETNVGAGLPIINTMNDLVAGGDTILRIEGVLSGTLSYLFNSFDGSRPFSEIVREARRLGLTEPDPREDLNGLDVARKLLILAREAGHPLELEGIRMTPLIPRSLLRSRSVPEFFSDLRSMDRYFERQRLHAAQSGNVLRYIASFADGKAVVSLQEVGRTHPCYALSGSDIIIALTTVNCRDHPIVIKGPGAGAEVTATGVFADIIRISHDRS